MTKDEFLEHCRKQGYISFERYVTEGEHGGVYPAGRETYRIDGIRKGEDARYIVNPAPGYWEIGAPVEPWYA